MMSGLIKPVRDAMRNWPNVLRALDAMESLKAMSLIVLIGWSDKCRVSVVVRAHEVEIIFESDHVDPVRRTEQGRTAYTASQE